MLRHTADKQPSYELYCQWLKEGETASAQNLLMRALFITVPVAEKVSAMHTAEFFAQRVGVSQPGDLASFLSLVPDRPPVQGDEPG